MLTGDGLTLTPLAVNFEDRWWPMQTIWIQMKPHKMWGFIWDPNCLTFGLYISKKKWVETINFLKILKEKIFEKITQHAKSSHSIFYKLLQWETLCLDLHQIKISLVITWHGKHSDHWSNTATELIIVTPPIFIACNHSVFHVLLFISYKFVKGFWAMIFFTTCYF